MFLEHFEEVIPGVRRAIFRPAVDQDRPLAGGRDLKLRNQPLRLNR